MELFGITMGHIATITKYIAILTYIFVALSRIVKQKPSIDYINDILCILYGFVWAVAICGILINNIFYKKIMQRHNLSRYKLIFDDIFGHILPLYLIYYYAPKTTRVMFRYYALFIILFTILLGNFFATVYVGVPKPLLVIAAPLIAISAFYIRYVYQ